MALADIDAGATRRRVQEIAAGARKAFEAHAQRSAELDAASRAAAAKEEADLKAVRERRAELDARKAAEEAPETKGGSRPKRTLKLGARGDEEDTAGQDKPVQKRPSRPGADDDMSGRTWLR
jgi:hypothetical protein